MTTTLSYVPKLGGCKADGGMRDASDHDDYKFEDNKAAIAALGGLVADPGSEVNGILDLRKWCSPVEDQGHLGSCVANATVGSLEFLQIRNGLPLNDLSRLFIYYNARLMHQDQDVDEGSYIRLAMGTLSSLGTCSESKWPYDVTKVFVRPSWGSYREAFVNKIGSYYRITDGAGRDDQIVEALKAQHPVVFGTVVDQEFMNYKGGVMPMPKSTRVNAGGHAMLICGFDRNRQCWLVRNSWSKYWGEGGYCWIPWAYFDASPTNDLWVPTALK